MLLLKISIDQKLSQRIAFKLLVAYNVIEVIIMSELTKIPYVGKATAASLNLIGYETIASNYCQYQSFQIHHFNFLGSGFLLLA